MVNAKQIEFTYRNNFYVQACACISRRSLSGSEVLHFFFVLYVIMLALWSSFVFWMPHGPSQINTVGSGLGNEVWNLRDLEPV